jgi:uncharacterized protein
MPWIRSSRSSRKGVAGLVDGEHFFDLLAEDVIIDYIITAPGYPRRVEGRHAVADLYRPYGATIVLDRCYDLAVHHDQATGVVVLEYASQGRVIPSSVLSSSRPPPSVLPWWAMTATLPKCGSRRRAMTAGTALTS